MAKSDEMYKKSPKIEKDKDGKAGISKPKGDAKEATETDKGEVEGAGDGMPIDIHQKERESMHKRHEEEQKGMHDRHQKDLKEMHKRHHELAATEAGKVEETK